MVKSTAEITRGTHPPWLIFNTTAEKYVSSTTKDETLKSKTRIQWHRHTSIITRIMRNVVTNMTIITAVPAMLKQNSHYSLL